MFQGRRETFSSKPGPTLKLTKQTKPIEIFYEMFDNDFIELLCIATNRKAEDMIALSRKQNKFTTQSRFYQWVPIDRDEMITFLAIIILQGLYRLQNDKAYFVFNGFGTTPYFAKIMSYDRFTLLKDCLCFENNHDIQDTTRLGKIKPVIDYLNLKFSGLYMPSQEIVIDETLLKCNGRLSFAQKVSSRAARTGVKTYELCESLTSYLWKFYVDAGKDKSTGLDEAHTNDDLDEDDTNGELDKEETIIDQFAKDVEAVDIIPSENEDCSIKIVYNLIEPLLHRGHTLIMDNFYNSPLLLRHLKKHKTDCYGTLRLSREFVPDSVKKLTKKNLRQGEAIGTHCSDLGIMVWRDANIVSMISTYHNFQTRSLETTNKMGYKPIIVDDYKKCMATLHKKDQFQSPQPMNRVRCRGWYKTLFYRLYNAGIFNCFVIYSSFHTGITHRNFRVALAEDLVRIHRQICIIRESRSLNINPEVPSSNMTGDVKTLEKRRNIKARPTVEGNHFPMRTGSYHTRCRFCPKKTRTVWKCEECNVNLCILGCFKAFHKS
ncbi:piggyBac transposable element-derived protein 4-like [Spodoptera litura]|uniref:PiggyBac transposable element-derived protein 4-like n=1 Tax=Spodoptera litura TaxID=69820 RepID=A0A9J7E5W3_SPOLT|nr:piggyBac transposable element-derived protein 4-like [Spodoptera litura]XP_022822075.1 piggyBac transposable element-derived protein 4-like [Spodoptera litura]XP_022822076.1 piggyBac transposable element-derived protein 4-like [Spodoptera litura]XP_022822077.1 piggyBac transposable element-derived protein 4-like [Spodoptera litura]